MDAATMKEMLTLFGQAGESAKELFFWWIVLENVPPIIFGACWSGIFIWVLKKCYGLFKNHLVSEQLRLAAGVYYWNNEHIKKATKLLTEHWDEI